MQPRTDSGNWALPGGTMDIGETLGQCIVREVKEEAGLDIEITGLLGIYTDPAHVISYTDGDVRQEFNITHLGESSAAGSRSATNRPKSASSTRPSPTASPIRDTVRLRLRHHAEHRDAPYLG